MRLTTAVLFVLMSSTVAAAQAAPSDGPVIISQGESILSRAPDRAWLTIATEVRDSKAANARRKSAEAMTDVQAAIKAAGIPPDAIRTSAVGLVPEMQYGPGRPSVRQYVVRHQIEVRVDDLDNLADIIAAANAPKNVVINIGTPRFELKDREGVELEAVSAAVKAAMARARAMAAGAGQQIGPTIRIQQNTVSVAVPAAPAPPRPVGAAARGGGAWADAQGLAVAETPIAPGELEVRASVTVTIGIR
jgi:uncharacterized protein YggE